MEGLKFQKDPDFFDLEVINEQLEIPQTLRLDSMASIGFIIVNLQSPNPPGNSDVHLGSAVSYIYKYGMARFYSPIKYKHLLTSDST